MFTQKALDWDYDQYSHYGTVSSLFTVIGALVIVPIITMMTDLQDAAIGLLGSLSRASERIVYAFATNPSEGWLMYLGGIISLASPLCPIAIRSLISKLAIEDVGQVYSVMAVGESLLPFVTAPVYNSIYQATLEVYPGAFYVVSVAVNICMALCFVYLLVAMRPSSPRSVPIENEENSETES
ncbi:hypothetical protein Avbf_01600 [Armadillidium vulgare]|nr:hypothetical protein Avbf_01600 [Armadillidium vulgare]